MVNKTGHARCKNKDNGKVDTIIENGYFIDRNVEFPSDVKSCLASDFSQVRRKLYLLKVSHFDDVRLKT
jgi:hypothetical protein